MQTVFVSRHAVIDVDGDVEDVLGVLGGSISGAQC